MATSTIFSGFNQPVENKALILILNDIKNGIYRTDIESIRSCIASGDTEKADQLKKQLPAFTPSGTYEGGRKAHLLKRYSGFVHLDFDKLSPDQLKEAFLTITQIPYTFGCLRSPSGKGLKVFVEVNTTAVHHDIAYRQVQNYYENALGIPADPKCKDITRLCFVSDDPELYKNLGNKKFVVQLPESENDTSSVPDPKPAVVPSVTPDVSEDLNARFIFNQQIEFTNQKADYTHGNRNNYMYMLASNCNRAGLTEDVTLQLCLQDFDLSEKEIRSSVKSAYANHTVEFAKFANLAKLQTSASGTSEDAVDYLKNTPILPDDLFNNLPLLLKSGAQAFTDRRERDVFLTGAVAILSGCMPKVRGIYDKQTVYPNLFAFIIAPAASGKGVLKFSKMLAAGWHDSLLRSSREQQQQYETDLNDYKIRQRSKKKNEPAEGPPIQPPFKVVFIPANASYAKILTHLQQNEGEGIICETEADTMSNVLKQEWGGYSDMLRKAFHHEPISSSKKTNNEYIEVNEPRLSVALSGTPNQVTGLIASAEDGLFSRFIYYAYKVDQQWRDVSPNANNLNLTVHFSQLSRETHEIISFLQQNPTSVELSHAQWDRLNTFGSQFLYEVATFTGDDACSIVKRLGLILFRIAMIFTALRKVENGDTSQNVHCLDSDFETALSLADLYLNHSLLMFQNLPKQSESTQFRKGDNHRLFMEALPQEFTTQQATEIGKQFRLSYSTVTHLLPKLVPAWFMQPKAGFYIKK